MAAGPVLLALWKVVRKGMGAPDAGGSRSCGGTLWLLARHGARSMEPDRTRLHQPARGLVRELPSPTRLTRGLKTKTSTLNFVWPMARGMA